MMAVILWLQLPRGVRDTHSPAAPGINSSVLPATPADCSPLPPVPPSAAATGISRPVPRPAARADPSSIGPPVSRHGAGSLSADPPRQLLPPVHRSRNYCRRGP